MQRVAERVVKPALLIVRPFRRIVRWTAARASRCCASLALALALEMLLLAYPHRCFFPALALFLSFPVPSCLCCLVYCTHRLEIEYTYNGTAVWLPVSFQLDKGWKNGTDAKTTAYIRTHTSKTNRPSIVDGNTTQNWPMHFATGVRYAFGQSCCSYFAREGAACPGNSCPLRPYNSTLPVVPFIAKFVDGRCKCTPPMVCDA